MLLPGHVRKIRDEDVCPCQYDECQAQATHEYLIEASSMGDEYLPLCEAHVEQFRKDVEAGGPCIGECDWCKASDVEISPFRDWEEGMNGPVSDVCDVCIRKSNARANEEMDLVQRSEEELHDMQDEELGEDPYSDEDDMTDEEILAMFANDDPAQQGLIYNNPDLDKQFQINGPVLSNGQIGFAGHWVDGLNVVIALDLDSGIGFWKPLAAEEIEYMSFYRVALIFERIRALGYPVKTLEEL